MPALPRGQRLPLKPQDRPSKERITNDSAMGHVPTWGWRSISIGNVQPFVIGDANGTVDYVRYVGHRVDDQMSIFSAISIASSTSMPR